MRIGLVTSHLEIGGIPRHVVTLSRALVRRGHAVTVVSGGGVLVGELGQAGIVYRGMPLRTKSEVHPKLLAAVLALRRIVRQDGIDLLHAHTRVAQVVAAAVSAATGVPFVTTCHGFYRLRLGRRLVPCWGRRVIAISGAVRRWLLAAGVPDDRIVTVLNGIDVEPGSWIVDEGALAQFRQAAGLDSGPVVGIVGRVVQVKGHRWLLEAFARVASEITEAQLLVVGDGPDRPTLEQMAAAMGLSRRVRCVASVPDVRIALAAMDVVAVPSLWEEPFGLVVVEAMAAGRAVVASNAGGIPEIIRDGETGVLVERGDTAGLIAALGRLLRDDACRSRLAEAGRQAAVERFSSGRMAAEVEAVYCAVATR